MTRTVLMGIAAVLIAIAFLGQIGPLTEQLRDLSAVSLIFGIALSVIATGMAARERSKR